MILRNFFIFYFSIQLLGCSATGPVYYEINEPGDDESLLYIYRTTKDGGLAGRDSYFYINDIKVASLNHEGFTHFYLPPGEYKLTQSMPIDISVKKIEHNITLKPGEKVYFNFSVGLSKGSLITAFGMYGGFTWHFTQENAMNAKVNMRGKHYQEAFNINKLYSSIGVQENKKKLFGSKQFIPLSRENTDTDFYGKDWSAHDVNGVYFACVKSNHSGCGANNFNITQQEYNHLRSSKITFKQLYLRYHKF